MSSLNPPPPCQYRLSLRLPSARRPSKRCFGLTWGAGAPRSRESFRSWGPWCRCKKRLPSGVGRTVVVECRFHVTLPSPAPIL
eukprot:2849803-Rhodomonas_salina.1